MFFQLENFQLLTPEELSGMPVQITLQMPHSDPTVRPNVVMSIEPRRPGWTLPAYWAQIKAATLQRGLIMNLVHEGPRLVGGHPAMQATYSWDVSQLGALPGMPRPPSRLVRQRQVTCLTPTTALNFTATVPDDGTDPDLEQFERLLQGIRIPDLETTPAPFSDVI